MHKFFCNYNHLTERYELALAKNNFFPNKAIIQAEQTLLPQIKQDIQTLYENIVILKEEEKNEDNLNKLDEIELLVSNLYYSLFASPLELVEKREGNRHQILQHCLLLINTLQKNINIPEYNRLCILVKNNLDFLITT